jgi:hypothetical protein
MKNNAEMIINFENRIDELCSMYPFVANLRMFLLGLIQFHYKLIDTGAIPALSAERKTVVSTAIANTIGDLWDVDAPVERVGWLLFLLGMSPDENTPYAADIAELKRQYDGLGQVFDNTQYLIRLNQSYEVKNSPHPLVQGVIKTVGDLKRLLEQVPFQDILIDDLRIENPEQHMTVLDFSSGEVRCKKEPVRCEPYTNEEHDMVISEDLTVGTLLALLKPYADDVIVKSVRLKGASNAVFVGVHLEGLVICD